jgi:3-methyladenine DNA glycosylase AlkD
MSASVTISAQSILDEIKPLGRENYRKILRNHGIKEPLYGVKIEDLKKIQKRVKKDYQLALDLFDTGVYDAMYLAGLIAVDLRMTKEDLQGWVERANSPVVCGCTVAWVAAGSNHGWELGLEWIESKNEDIAAAGWCTLSGLVALKEDSELDLKEIKRLLGRVGKTIHEAPNCVRYVMNDFVITVGSYVRSLTDDALAVAKKMGKVEVDMGDTACKLPDVSEHIKKVKQRGAIGKKRKTVKC